MAKTPTFSAVTNSDVNASEINAAIQAVADQFEQVLFLDGSTPNAMNADLDMNSNDILNASSLDTARLLINGGEVSASDLVLSALVIAQEYATVAALLASTDTYTAGAYVHVVEGDYYYKAAASGDVTNAGGQQFEVLAGESGYNVKAFGAKGDASSNDTASTVAALDAADIGTILGATRHTTVYIPAGVYDLDATLRLAPSTNDNRLIVRGDGDGNTVLRFSNTTGDAVDIVGGYITLEDLTIDATAARTAGAGNGIDIQDSLTTTTQFRVELNRVTVQNQPGKGIRGRCPEFLTCTNVSANGNGEQGFYFDDDGHTTFGSWNTFINCRAKDNDLSGFWFDNVSCVYMVNPQALNNTLGGDGQIHFRGGCTNIEVFGADPEAQDVIDASPAVSNVVGIRVQGCRNVRLTGTKSAALDRVISLANNDLVEINGIEHSNNGEASNTEYLVYCDTGNSNVRISGIRELADYAQTDALIYDAVPGGCVEYLGQEANEPKHGAMSVYKSPVGSFAGGSYDDAWTALELYNNESDTGAAQETGISFNYLNAGSKVPGSIKLVENGTSSTTGYFDIRPPNGGSETVGLKVYSFGVLELGGGGQIWRVGTGTPEGSVTAPVGSMFTRTDGGASTTLYVKESGTGNTGWVAK